VLILPLAWLALHWGYDAVSPWNVDDALKMTGVAEPDVPLATRLIHLHAHWSMLLMPLDLVGHGLLAVFDVPLAALPAPTWLIRGAAVSLVGAVVVAAARMPRSDRQRLLAVAILVASAYLTIALGRGQLFGALIAGGRLPFFGRYHYLPALLLTVLLCLMVNALQAVHASRRVQYGLFTVALLAVAVRIPLAALPIGQDPVRTAVENAVDDIRRQLASAPPGAAVDIPNRRVPGLKVLARREEFPGLAAIFVIFYPPTDLQERRVRFVERHASVVAAAQRGRRSRGLIVGREAVPSAPPAGSAPALQPRKRC
jgi:hypothetical protein